jgi:hypothetical protein
MVTPELPANALELIGRGQSPPRPKPMAILLQTRQTRPASPVRSSEMLGSFLCLSKLFRGDIRLDSFPKLLVDPWDVS